MLTSYERRKFRVRNKIATSNKSGRPRLSVFRSNKNIYAQLIAIDGNVICASSTLKLDEKKKSSGIEKAKNIGLKFAEICLKAGAKEVVFDKGAYLYSGRIKALAEGCREGGLQF
jgi:large subunit ribosomal protein L18